MEWTSGAARGKKFIFQVVNRTPAGDLKQNDVIILTPGGGSGPNDVGCRAQYGTTWYVMVLITQVICLAKEHIFAS